MSEAQNILKILNEHMIVPVEKIQKAIAKRCKDVVKEGHMKPEFHVNGKKVLPDDSDSKYGIAWDGDYADFDNKDLESLVYEGDTVSLQFTDGEGEIKGEVTCDTTDFHTNTEYEDE